MQAIKKPVVEKVGGLKLDKMVRFSSLLVWLFLCGAVCSLPLQGMGHSGKVAVMADSGWNWANGWPETDYLSVLRETVSAGLFGYRYDLINETMAQDVLNSYAMVIFMPVPKEENHKLLCDHRPHCSWFCMMWVGT